MKKNERDLFEYWVKNIKNKRIYRMMTEEYLFPQVSELNPKKNPYKKEIDNILELANLVIKQEKKGNIFRLDWGNERPVLSDVLRLSLNDLYENSVDFTTSYKEALEMSTKWKGGALATNIKGICGCLFTMENELLINERKLLKHLYSWSQKRMTFKNIIIAVGGGLDCLETAKFQHRIVGLKDIYWSSPYGRFDHFKNISESDLGKFIPYLEGSKNAYLRVDQIISLRDAQTINP